MNRRVDGWVDNGWMDGRGIVVGMWMVGWTGGWVDGEMSG